MTYSSCYDAQPAGLTIYDKLEIGSNLARKKRNTVHLLSMKKTGGTRIEEGGEVTCVVDMGEGLDLILSADEPRAIELAMELSRNTGTTVGIARYEKGQDPWRVDANAQWARRLAELGNQPVHLYNPATDSSEAIFGRHPSA